jgi:single-strand DNA-binding protein
MSSLKNKVQLIGNLGMDAEIVNLESGKKLAKFSIATNEVYKNQKGERVTNTDWHNLIAWGKTAELVEKLLVKGSEVAIEGKLTSRSYEDKEGVKRYITEVVVNEFLLLSGGNPKYIDVKEQGEVK